MSDYRRYFIEGGTYFFTLVTERRAPLFDWDTARTLLGSVRRRCAARYPMVVVAVVLLPDHLHAPWTLPTGDDRYSLRWRWIFTRVWDRFQVPNPFTTIHAYFGEPMFAREGESVEQYRSRIEIALNELEQKHDPVEAQTAREATARR